MKTEAEFIVAFFDELNKQSIKYCVLRNYHEIPDHIGHDVDILADDVKWKAVCEILDKLVIRYGWYSRLIWSKDYFYTVIVYGVDEAGYSQLKLDIWTKLHWRGIPWIDSRFVLKTVRSYQNFYIPAPGCEAAISMIKEIMGGGEIPSKYHAVITAGIKEDRACFIKGLSPCIGKKEAEAAAGAAEAGQWDQVEKNEKQLKKKVIAGAFRRGKILNHVCYLVKESGAGILKSVSGRKLLIAFVGPDGSGKTTVIQRIQDRFHLLYPNQKLYHTRFEVFPELHTGLGLSNLRTKDKKAPARKQKEKAAPRKTAQEPNKQQDEQSLISKAASWVVLFYYTVEFVVGRALFFRNRRNNAMVLFDRYYYDFFVQPNTRDLIWKWKELLLWMVPKPDLVIHLYADGQTVFERKGELNIREIDTQNAYFERLFADFTNYHKIDTRTHNASEVVDCITAVILDTLEKRKS